MNFQKGDVVEFWDQKNNGSLNWGTIGHIFDNYLSITLISNRYTYRTVEKTDIATIYRKVYPTT